MANENKNGYSALSDDTERDMGAKGGPTTTLGNPDNNHNISHPYSSDTQTQLAAASTQNKNNSNKNEKQSEVESDNDISEDNSNILSERDEDIMSKD